MQMMIPLKRHFPSCLLLMHQRHIRIFIVITSLCKTQGRAKQARKHFLEWYPEDMKRMRIPESDMRKEDFIFLIMIILQHEQKRRTKNRKMKKKSKVKSVRQTEWGNRSPPLFLFDLSHPFIPLQSRLSDISINDFHTNTSIAQNIHHPALTDQVNDVPFGHEPANLYRLIIASKYTSFQSND